MSTQPDFQKQDIDGTEELPVLDVAAYEASLTTQESDETARTDSWAVTALQMVNILAEQPSEASRRTAFGGQPKPELAAGNVSAILERIRELEAQVVAVKSANATLEQQCRTLAAERNSESQQAKALQAENTRLLEHRDIGAQMVQRLEDKLQLQTTQFTAQITELQQLRETEGERAEQMLIELQRQSAERLTALESLQKEHAGLTAQLVDSSGVATSRAGLIAQLQHALAQEQSKTRQLTDQLVGKLVEHDKLSRGLEASEQTIENLNATCLALRTQLRLSEDGANELAAQLSAAKQQLVEERALLGKQANDLADRNGRVQQLTKEIEHVQSDIRLLNTQHDEHLVVIATQKQECSLAQSRLAQSAVEIQMLNATLQSSRDTATTLQQQLKTTADALVAETEARQQTERMLTTEKLQHGVVKADLQQACSTIKSLTEERDALLPLRDELRSSGSALRESEEALAHSNSALTELWTNVTSQAAEINRLTEVQAATQKTVDELLTERETLQSYLGMERQTVATLREQLLGQAMQLHAIEQEVGEVRTHLGEREAELTATQSVLGEREKRVESLEQLLQTSRRDHTKAIEEMTHSQRRIQKLTERLSDRTRQAADLKSELAVYAESLAAIRRTLAQTNQEALGEMMGYLRILEPIEHEGPTIALERAITTIGRTQDNDVCVPLNVVSRHHARLLATPNGVIIEDAGSKNGCFVNGRQIHHQLMRDGDVLALGNLRFRLSKLRAAGGRMQNVAAAALPAAN